MQSQRKNSGSYLGRQQSNTIQAAKSSFLSKKKLSIASQTDNLPTFSEQNRLYNFSSMSMEEIKDSYTNTLHFLNNCHNFLNGKFKESVATLADGSMQKPFEFRIPEVPNYMDVLDLFLEKRRVRTESPLIQNLLKSGKDEGIKKRTIESTLYHLEPFVLKNIGDGPGSIPSPRQDAQSPDNDGNPLQPKGKSFDTGGSDCLVNNFHLDLKSFGLKQRASLSPSRLVKSEKDIPKRSSRHELKSFSTTFEEILKTCDQFEKKSRENDVPLEICQNYRDKNVEEEVLRIKTLERNEDAMDEDSSKTLNHDAEPEDIGCIESRHQQNFNLLEYALKNFKKTNFDSDSPWSTPRNENEMDLEQIKAISSNGLLAGDIPEMLLNLHDPSAKNKRPLSILNDPSQTRSPKRVNELFEKISRENLRSYDGQQNNSADNDKASSDYSLKVRQNQKIKERLRSSDSQQDSADGKLGSNYSLKFRQDRKDMEVKIASSSDSIILNDEEFERRARKSFLHWTRDEKGGTINRRATTQREVYNFCQEDQIIPRKSHPLTLTDKDRCQADQKILKSIGLFTEKGDIRPAIINILEEKQRANFTQRASKNVQFRTRRKFDVKMHYNISTRTEEQDKQFDETFADSDSSLQSSAVTFTSSTVSDSDLLNTEPIVDQKTLNKCYK